MFGCGFPDMHSDVGGGYRQRRTLRLAQVPHLDARREALEAGLP